MQEESSPVTGVTQAVEGGGKVERKFKRIRTTEVEDEDSDEEEDCEGDDIPTIKIPQELKEKLRKPWRKALIIKILGKTVAYKTLIGRSKSPYGMPLEDNGSLHHGSKMASQFRGSKCKYSLHGRLIGKPLKIDYHTAWSTRGRFVRICFEIDLNTPLLSKVRIGNRVYIIEYEGLHFICFKCGVVGHRATDFLANQKENHSTREVNRETKNQDQQEMQEDEENEKIQQEEKEVTQDRYGPWMLVQRRQRGSRINPKNQKSRNQELRQNNRFDSLNIIDEEETNNGKEDKSRSQEIKENTSETETSTKEKKPTRREESNNRIKGNNLAGSSGEGKSRTRYDKPQSPILNAKRDNQGRTQGNNHRRESNQSNVLESNMEVEKMMGKHDKISMDVENDTIQQDN
ncbi:hypothetical protein F3Y22_tig00110505pilonHSYRG00257 [Hibiscus syriacus]|uniref:Zinc knuckle CX2CX4HX4C domain-containing protein n=1 Tax=Hibiscus syriacus TaxID=106335 RepID=A0A6A3ACQ7_HIBSY|nr:hypothetical protein F3Y22_tig00110505pilonHSYRG00257 [Hibiscus syriacus]